jgi:hypothetical protein
MGSSTAAAAATQAAAAAADADPASIPEEELLRVPTSSSAKLLLTLAHAGLEGATLADAFSLSGPQEQEQEQEQGDWKTANSLSRAQRTQLLAVAAAAQPLGEAREIGRNCAELVCLAVSRLGWAERAPHGGLEALALEREALTLFLSSDSVRARPVPSARAWVALSFLTSRFSSAGSGEQAGPQGAEPARRSSPEDSSAGAGAGADGLPWMMGCDGGGLEETLTHRRHEVTKLLLHFALSCGVFAAADDAAPVLSPDTGTPAEATQPRPRTMSMEFGLEGEENMALTLLASGAVYDSVRQFILDSDGVDKIIYIIQISLEQVGHKKSTLLSVSCPVLSCPVSL